MQCTIPNTFQNGTGENNIIDAVKVNANFTAIATVLNGNIEKDNIKTGSVICLSDTAMTVSAAWTFSANPIFNAGGIADSYLTANIPKKDTANTFTALQTFNTGIDLNKTQAKNFLVEFVASLPEWQSSDKGRLLFCTGDNYFYGGGSTGWVRLDYTGDYTGGAITRYASMGIVDDNDAFKLYFKTEGDTPTIKIAIKGEPFPKRFYTELPYHTHTFSGSPHGHDITDPQHYHTTYIPSHGHGTTQYSTSNHTHPVSGQVDNTDLSHTHGVGTLATGEQGAHLHGGVTTGSGSTYVCNTHTHPITGATANWNIANLHKHSFNVESSLGTFSQAIEETTIGNVNSGNKSTGITVNNNTAGGSNSHAGVDISLSLSEAQKLYAKSLTVKIDDTNVTSDILTATGWGAIGDGTGSHAFHTAGTGELDASAWKSYSPGLHVLEINEPESGYGSSLMIHIETS